MFNQKSYIEYYIEYTFLLRKRQNFNLRMH